MVAEREREGRGMEWAFGVGRCKLLHLEWINNKVLLYSTGNYVQYPVMNHSGKEYKKMIRTSQKCATCIFSIPT